MQTISTLQGLGFIKINIYLCARIYLMRRKMIIIPDIHGRTFWKDAVKDREEEDIVFLGDYLDPYPFEWISKFDAIENFFEIIDFKFFHPQNVTLLLGNHDLMTYISEKMGSCRTDFDHLDMIRRIFVDNHALFQMACTRHINERCYAFSHAGIHKGWAQEPSVSTLLNIDTNDIEAIIHRLNQMWETKDKQLFDVLNHVSYYRGGIEDYGSPVWAHYEEWSLEHYEYDGWYQIFGHSQMRQGPVISNYWANLDCRRAFELNNAGIIMG